ncbi:MAG TPA: GNAT family N-acetyltransferase [Trebonia sp.]|jgi:ribosomal-protein-serine acetyltransferase|nr:GNAT family N-acetyltransferase [Trebonia sp.]
MRYRAEPPRPPEVIDAGPVTLRRWRAADLAASCDAVLASLDHLRPWMPWAADFSRASQAEFLAGCERDWESGAAFNYAMLADGAIAGSVGLMARIGPGGLEIGYWVHQAHTRRGLATAASAALVEQAFALPGIERVQIVHDEFNVASGGVPRKLGFTVAGRRPLDHRPPGGTGMGVVWELTRAQWQGTAPRLRWLDSTSHTLRPLCRPKCPNCPCGK